MGEEEVILYVTRLSFPALFFPYLPSFSREYLSLVFERASLAGDELNFSVLPVRHILYLYCSRGLAMVCVIATILQESRRQERGRSVTYLCRSLESARAPAAPKIPISPTEKYQLPTPSISQYIADISCKAMNRNQGDNPAHNVQEYEGQWLRTTLAQSIR